MTTTAKTPRTRRRKPAEIRAAAQAVTAEVEPRPAEAPAKAPDTMVEVNNLRAMNYTQPSTQIRIAAGARRVKALDDGWLQAQLKAGLLERCE